MLRSPLFLESTQAQGLLPHLQGTLTVVPVGLQAAPTSSNLKTAFETGRGEVWGSAQDSRAFCWQPPPPLPTLLDPCLVCVWSRQRNSQEPTARMRGGDERKLGNELRP